MYLRLTFSDFDQIKITTIHNNLQKLKKLKKNLKFNRDFTKKLIKVSNIMELKTENNSIKISVIRHLICFILKTLCSKSVKFFDLIQNTVSVHTHIIPNITSILKNFTLLKPKLCEITLKFNCSMKKNRNKNRITRKQ